MPPDPGGVPRGCPLWGRAICPNVISREEEEEEERQRARQAEEEEGDDEEKEVEEEGGGRRRKRGYIEAHKEESHIEADEETHGNIELGVVLLSSACCQGSV